MIRQISRPRLPSRPFPKSLYLSRWPLFLARAVTLAGFVMTIFAGLFGSVVGSHNFAIIFVWIAWWTLLKLVFIPLGGRSWCSVCPIPMPGEWLTQGGIFPSAQARGLGLGRKWPTTLKLPGGRAMRLRGNWLQAGGFLLIGLASAVTLTTPGLTGWVLVAVFGIATALALVFDKPNQPSRPFCNSLCPIGGFTGLYAQAAPIEVRVTDRAVCAAHAEKTCYDACPWGIYIAAQTDNTACGMCFECLRICPNDNVTVNLRAFGKDLLTPQSGIAKDSPVSASSSVATRKLRLDEVYLALIMLGCALSFSAVFLGPWGVLRRAAYAIGSLDWAIYAAGFLLFAGLLVPGLYLLAVKLTTRGQALRKAAAALARPLLPLGLATWIAFTISFAFAKVSYILPVLSDPFGLGWNLFGTARTVFNPDVSLLAPLLQAAVLLGGLLFAGKIARQDAAKPAQAAAVQAYALLITLGMMVLLLG